ncbi:MAG: hypothetical protein HUK22_07015, partial [Thermoguttaceae bacterium]|nr:hypothetical protein [Thermoguttaceae bacterium]
MLKLFSIFSKKKEVTPVRPVKRERVVTTADRDAAVEAVAALNGEEEILAFLAECKYADARYAAAQRITSDEGLEKLKTLTRNSDRRVYKWASAELDRRKDSVSKLEKAKALVSEAVALVKAETLTPNRVAEIERAWDTFTDKAQDVETAIVSKFREARQSLHDRLAAQIDLQLKLKTSIADAENTELD